MSTLLDAYAKAENGQLEDLETLLAAGVDFGSDEAKRVVDWAVSDKSGDPRDELVIRQIDPNMILGDGESVLFRAIYSSAKHSVKLLLDRGAVLGSKEFEEGHYDKPILTILLEHVDPNAEWEEPPAWQMADLYDGANEDAILRLLERGANPSCKNQKDGKSLLQAVIHSDSNRVATALIERGADVHAKAHDGTTALHTAAFGYGPGKGRAAELVKLLLTKDADPNAADNNGATPLHNARSDATARALIEAGANIKAKAKDRYGTVSVLDRIIAYVSADLVATLLDDGVSGQALLQSVACTETADPATVALLVARGEDLEEANSECFTALHYAAWNGNPRIGNALLDAGAKVGAKNNNKMTPVDEWLEKIDQSTPEMLAFGERMLAMTGKVSVKTQKRVERFKAKLAKQREKIAAFEWSKLEEHIFKTSKKLLATFAKQHSKSGPFSAFCFDSNLGEGEVLLCLGSADEHAVESDNASPGDWLHQGFAVIRRGENKKFDNLLKKVEIDGVLEEEPFACCLDSICRVALRLDTEQAFAKLSTSEDFQVYVTEHDEMSSAANERMARIKAE